MDILYISTKEGHLFLHATDVQCSMFISSEISFSVRSKTYLQWNMYLYSNLCLAENLLLARHKGLNTIKLSECKILKVSVSYIYI
jgi:hypothetical protein